MLVGSHAVQYTEEWRYTSWVALMLGAMALLCLITMRETQKDAIQRSILSGEGNTKRWQSLRSALRQRPFFSIVDRPLRFKLIEPVVASIGFYTAFSFGIFYGLFAAVPYVYRKLYGFDRGASGSTWLALCIGFLLATLLNSCLQTQLVRIARQPGIQAQFKPEWVLQPAMIGSPLIPISLLWLAWTALRNVHFMVSIVTSYMYAMVRTQDKPLIRCALTSDQASYLCFVSGLTYLIQFYGSRFGAAAAAGAVC